MNNHMKNLIFKYQRFILILAACTIIFALYYYIKFSNVVTFNVGIDVNVHRFESDVKINISKSDEEINGNGFVLVSRYYE